MIRVAPPTEAVTHAIADAGWAAARRDAQHVVQWAAQIGSFIFVWEEGESLLFGDEPPTEIKHLLNRDKAMDFVRLWYNRASRRWPVVWGSSAFEKQTRLTAIVAEAYRRNLSSFVCEPCFGTRATGYAEHMRESAELTLLLKQLPRQRAFS